MKQHVTREQYNELPDEHRRCYEAWVLSKSVETTIWAPPEHNTTIGHLIWFLDEHHATTLPYWNGGFVTRVYSRHPGQERDQWDIGIECPHDEKYYEQTELVDALWLAVKDVLSQDSGTEQGEKAG